MSVLREILARFGVEFDDTQLKQGDAAVSAMSEKLKGFGKLLAGAFAVKAIVNFTEHVLKEGDALAKASVGLGLAARELQELEHAAGLSGVGVEALRGSLARLQKGASEAAETAKGPTADALKKLGIEAKNNDGTLRSSADLFEDIADGLRSIENPTEKAGIAADLFGKSYAQLIPLLNEGREGIAKLRAEVGELGFGFDEAFLEDAQAFNDNVDRLKLGLRGFAISAIGLVLPHLVRMSEGAVRVIKDVVRWTKNSNLLQAALVGLSLQGLLRASKAMGGLGAAIRAASAAFLRFALRIALPILLIDELITTFKGGDTLIKRFIDSMFGIGTTEKVVRELKDIWVDFTDVVLPEASAIAKQTARELSQAFGEALDWVGDRFGAFRKWLSEEIWPSLPAPLQDVLTTIGNMFSEAFAAIGRTVSNFIDSLIPLKDLFDIVDSKANAQARKEAREREAAAAAEAGKKGGNKNVGGAPAKQPATASQPVMRFEREMRVLTAPPAAGAGGAPSRVNNVNAPTTVNVHVPAGTPGQVAQSVGRAAERGARTGSLATLRAVTPGSG